MLLYIAGTWWLLTAQTKPTSWLKLIYIDSYSLFEELKKKEQWIKPNKAIYQISSVGSLELY